MIIKRMMITDTVAKVFLRNLAVRGKYFCIKMPIPNGTIIEIRVVNMFLKGILVVVVMKRDFPNVKSQRGIIPEIIKSNHQNLCKINIL